MFKSSLAEARAPVSAPREAISTGAFALDALLEGGVSPGQLVEISGPASSGKSSLAFGVCETVLTQGQAAAWVDPRRGFWPLAALESGLRCERLLVVRVPDGDGALKAAHLLLRCAGAVAVAVVDLPPAYRVSDAQLVKLQRLAERSGTALVFVTERTETQPSLGVAVSLRLAVRRRAAGPTSFGALEIEVLRNKAGPIRRTAKEVLRGPDRLRVRGSL